MHFSKAYAEVLGHFREVYLSNSIGLRKPEAAAFNHVVKAVGVPAPRIVFFDDSADNIAGARARGLTEQTVRSLVSAATESRTFGVLGEPRVNVLELNLALDAHKPN